jgi:hypothetical protein
MSITAHHWPASRSLFTGSEGINSSKSQAHLPKADSPHIIPAAMDQLEQPKSFSNQSFQQISFTTELTNHNLFSPL